MGLTYQGDDGSFTAEEIKRAREANVKKPKQKSSDRNDSNESVTDGTD